MALARVMPECLIVSSAVLTECGVSELQWGEVSSKLKTLRDLWTAVREIVNLSMRFSLSEVPMLSELDKAAVALNRLWCKSLGTF